MYVTVWAAALEEKLVVVLKSCELLLSICQDMQLTR